MSQYSYLVVILSNWVPDNWVPYNWVYRFPNVKLTNACEDSLEESTLIFLKNEPLSFVASDSQGPWRRSGASSSACVTGFNPVRPLAKASVTS